MKTKIYPFFAFVLVLNACSSDNHAESESACDSELIETDSVETKVEEVVIDSSGIIPGTDWQKDNLNGMVKSISVHSETVDGNGDVYGMGGSYEGKEYNRIGKQIQANSSGCCGAAFTTIDYKYNDKNQLTHRIIRQSDDWSEDDSDKEMTEKEKYFYNEEGVLVKMKIAGSDKVLTREHRYQFNPKGKLIKEEIEDVLNEDVYTLEYIFESTKRITKATGASNFTQVYYINDDGLTTNEELHFEDGNTQEIRYTHELDEMNNWVKRISESRYIYENGKKEDWKNYLIETRTITYFE